MKLTHTEQQIFDLIVAVAKKHKVLAKAVGGLVRDRLMGNETHDLDIVVSPMTGLEFANKVVEYIVENGLDAQTKVGVVQSNPEKSKNLETAILNLFGLEVQFAWFRKEIYNKESRIPQVEAGNLEDDALRRDFTINALYYDLEKQEIEDPTGEGLKDIQSKIIRTPLPPKQTFLDDPLRILRAVRFSFRLGFSIDPAIYEAVKDQEVLAAFRNKVSRERIEIEMRKIMTGPNPADAIRCLSDFGLLYDVFKFPEGYLDWNLDQKTKYHQLTVLDHTLEALKNLQTIFQKYDQNIFNKDKLVCSYAILFHDLGKLDLRSHGYKDNGTRRTYYNHEKYSQEAAEHILKQLPGTTNKEIDRVKLLIDGSGRVNPNYVSGNEVCNLSRKSICKFVKLMGNDWKNAIIVNMADASAKKKNNLDSFDFTYHSSMIDKIINIGAGDIQNMRPLLNGNEIAEIIGERGPKIGKIISRMLEWQFGNPMVEKKDAVGFVKSFK